MTSGVLVLALIFLGFALMLAGPRAVRGLAGCVVAPFGCLGKVLFALLFLSFVLFLGAGVLLQRLRSPVDPNPQPGPSTPGLPLPSAAFDTPWDWPLSTEDAGNVGQGYAQYGVIVLNQYHAGIDIGAEWGTKVLAPADGTVVKLQRNMGWPDHGLGHTVVTRHPRPGGGSLFALFAHLEEIDAQLVKACGEPPDPKQGRTICATAVPIHQGEVIGKAGSSGRGEPKKWGSIPHLHFEVRSFDTLGIGGDDESGEEVGYTDSNPEAREVAGRRYFDPMLPLHGAKSLPGATRVVTKDVLRYRVGPGGRKGSEYRAAGQLSEGQALEVVAVAPPTSQPRCNSGWYKIRLPGDQLLPDARYPAGGSEWPLKHGLTAAWACGDYLAR